MWLFSFLISFPPSPRDSLPRGPDADLEPTGALAPKELRDKLAGQPRAPDELCQTEEGAQPQAMTQPQAEELLPCKCEDETQGHREIQQLIVEDERDGQPWREDGQGTDHQPRMQSKFAFAYLWRELQVKDSMLQQVKGWLAIGNPPAINAIADAQLLRCPVPGKDVLDQYLGYLLHHFSRQRVGLRVLGEGILQREQVLLSPWCPCEGPRSHYVCVEAGVLFHDSGIRLPKQDLLFRASQFGGHAGPTACYISEEDMVM